MNKEKIIQFRVTEKEYEKIKLDAKRQGEKISSYVRLRIQEDPAVKWIKKTAVQQRLSKIENVLDKYEDRNNRMAEGIRKEVAKLWNML